MVAMRTKQQVAKCCPPLGVGVGGNAVPPRGTTEKGECRSLACKTMIEPNSWDLNEVKVQPSPLYSL